jgi:hypothetical protein
MTYCRQRERWYKGCHDCECVWLVKSAAWVEGEEVDFIGREQGTAVERALV